MVKEKFVCPYCSFESNGAGLCPTCDENLQKVCHCGSEKFAADCCGSNDSTQDTNNEELIKAEVTSETLTEMAKEDEIKQKEEDELANVEEVKED